MRRLDDVRRAALTPRIKLTEVARYRQTRQPPDDPDIAELVEKLDRFAEEFDKVHVFTEK